jgi:hypothetical protein
VQRTIARSWRTAGLLLLVTQVLPGAILSVALLAVTGSMQSGGPFPLRPGAEGNWIGFTWAALGAGFIGWVLVTLIQAAGWAAGTWALTREALGERVGLGDALAYGARRVVGLWAWTLLSGLIFIAGLCACILPGLYVLFPLLLVGPVYLFERSNPLGRAFKLFHRNMGPLLGRLALLVAVVLMGSVVIGVFQSLGPSGGFGPGAAVVAIVTAALYLPLYLVMLVSLVVTYAEQRAREAPINSHQLAAQLG